MEKSNPVFTVPVSTGIASTTAAASDNGVSLFRTYGGQDGAPISKIKSLTHHSNEPNRGAERTVWFGIFALTL